MSIAFFQSWYKRWKKKKVLAMKLIIYASPLNKRGARINKFYNFENSHIQQTLFSSIEDLGEHLRHPLGRSISLLMPANQDEMNALIRIRHLFRDSRIILVLPDIPDQSIPPCQAHILRPRFISYAKDSLSEVSAVIDKMMKSTASDITA